MKLSKEHLAEYEKIKDDVGAQTAESRKEVEAVERRIAVAQEQLARLNQQEEELQKKTAQLKDDKARMNERAARLNEMITATTAQIKALKQREAERVNEEKECKARQDALNNKLGDVQVRSTCILLFILLSLLTGTLGTIE
jgi:chromosome segregation ATPase